MRRAERLFRLINELQSREVSRAEDLAAQFEVSVRTIYRDIAHLQASGLPIDGEAGIGYLLRPGFNLPPLTFTHDQIDAIAAGLTFVESAGDEVLASAAREARAKLQASMPDPKARKLADAPYMAVPLNHPVLPHTEVLREAIRKRQIVEIDSGVNSIQARFSWQIWRSLARKCAKSGLYGRLSGLTTFKVRQVATFQVCLGRPNAFAFVFLQS